jgi:hypothetical protein
LDRCRLLAALAFLNLTPAVLCALPSPSQAAQIESLQSQYLAATSPEQRKQFIGELKAIEKNSPTADAGALNAAVATMLPAAASTWEAEELLTIGAAIPAGQSSNSCTPPADAQFLADARRASQEAGRANGDVETLANIRIDHLAPEGEGSGVHAIAHVQKIWRINNASGANSFSPRTVMYSGSTEVLCMVRAQVLKRNGRELPAEVSPDRPVFRRDASMYFDARSRELRFPHLQAGDLVQLEYLLLPAPEPRAWNGYYARIDALKESFPTRLQRRVLIAPSTMKLYAVARGLSPAAEQQQGAEAIRIWEARNPGNDVDGADRPYLQVSTFGSLEEFGRWYNQLLEPELALDPNLQKVAQQIAARNLTTDGKVQAVYETVKRLTKYTGFEFGVHSYQPYSVSLVEQRGFGDCKDKAAMLLALLRAVGVPAEFAMVRTRSAGEMAEGAYSLQQFNHAMVYVPELNLYLDGTAGSAEPGPLPSNDIGAVAITVDAQGNATRRTVQASEPYSDGMTREAQAHAEHDSDLPRISQHN